MQIVVLLALFTTAVLRRRWPSGLAARVGMRLLILGIGAALLWATTALLAGGASPSTGRGRARAWVGEKLTGGIPFGWGAAFLNALLTAVCIAFIHPVSLAWLLAQPSTLI